MRKTLAAANRGERVPFKIPRSVQQSIPIQRVWQDGIWQVNGRFSQTWRFADINYSLASYEDQRDMFTSYCGVLNSLPTDAVTKITIHNRRLNSSDFQHSVLMRECGDDLDLYRREYNRVLTEKAAASNNLIQDKYITVSVARKNAEEARAFFHRVDADLSKNLGRLDSGAKALDTYERLRILHDFFRSGEEQFYKFDLNASMRLGHSFKDYIAPDGMKFLSDHFELGGKVGRVLTEKAAASNNLIQDKYITVSVARKNAEEARAFFHRVDADLSKNLGRLDSGAKALDTYERLRILHDFFRSGEEQFYKFDLNASMRLGHSFKDYIAPDGMKFLSDHFELGGKVGRVLFMRKYSSYIKDDMITSMADFPRTLVLSIDLLPVPTDEAVRDVQSQIMSIESDITRWQQRQNARNNFTAVVPYELEQQRAETKEFLDDLSTRDQRMVYANVTLLHMADTLEQLDADTETLLSKSLCDFSILRYQQEDGFNTALPYGLRSIDVTRTLTTEAAASLMPFRVQEIQDMGGIYCGVNAVSKNLLICNRKNLLNPHGFILGVSGSGKSFTMKEFITFIALSTNDDIIIIDAEREYGDLVRALRGIVLEISPNSRHHINPLEIARGYGMGENPVALKSELLMSICEQQMGEGQLGAFHKSIIDRCTASVYHDFIKSGGKARQPILSDWRNEIKRQPEREAQELALASELFVEGSLNMFAHETNVDIDSRIIVFDLYEMGDQLKPTALNVTMETIQNRVATNRLAGKYTWVFVDEVYVRPEAA